MKCMSRECSWKQVMVMVMVMVHAQHPYALLEVWLSRQMVWTRNSFLVFNYAHNQGK